MKNLYSVDGKSVSALKKMLNRSHQITVRLQLEDKARLDKLCRLTGLNLSEVQIKFIDYLLNHEKYYRQEYVRGNFKPDMLTLDEGTSVSVRLNSHTFLVFRNLVKHLETNNGTLLRYIYQEKFRDMGFILGANYKNIHIDDVNEDIYKQTH